VSEGVDWSLSRRTMPLLTRGLLLRGEACVARGHSRIIFAMTEKEMVLQTVRELPDDCSLDEIADRIEFLAAVQKGLDQLDRGEGIPQDEIKKQLASWLTN
jgi:hypothetical protein